MMRMEIPIKESRLMKSSMDCVLISVHDEAASNRDEIGKKENEFQMRKLKISRIVIGMRRSKETIMSSLSESGCFPLLLINLLTKPKGIE